MTENSYRHQLRFRGIRKGDDYFTLDGKDKITTKFYVKELNKEEDINKLSYEELAFIVKEHIILSRLVDNHNKNIAKQRISLDWLYAY